jgi:hypothetical protein
MRMSLRSLSLSLLLALTGVAGAAEPVDPDDAARAEAATAEIRNAQDYLRDLRESVELARRGEYGKLAAADRKKLDASYERIKDLLGDHESPLELPLEDRIAMFNAQEAIVAIVERHPRDTMICRRKKSTGTRIPQTECLTIAQREARSRGAQEAMDRLPRPMCNGEAGC